MSKQSNSYIVRTRAGKYGFFYWQNAFVKGLCPVHFINDNGVEDKKPTHCDPRELTVVISIFNGKSKRVIKLPYIK